jgi:hypothetical protein
MLPVGRAHRAAPGTVGFGLQFGHSNGSPTVVSTIPRWAGDLEFAVVHTDSWTATFTCTSWSLNCGHARIQPLHYGAECIILCQVAAECPRVRCRRLPVVPICLSIVFRLPLQALAVQRHAAILKPEMT